MINMRSRWEVILDINDLESFKYDLENIDGPVGDLWIVLRTSESTKVHVLCYPFPEAKIFLKLKYNLMEK